MVALNISDKPFEFDANAPDEVKFGKLLDNDRVLWTKFNGIKLDVQKDVDITKNLRPNMAVFTDSQKKLVSNDITGTGLVVMSNNPTLIGTVTIDGNLVVTGSITLGDLLLSTEANITASIVQAQGQQPLTHHFNEVATVANDNDVVTMPTAEAGKLVWITNNEATAADDLQIFPASGDNFEGSAVNASITLESEGTHLLAYAKDNAEWEYLDHIVCGYPASKPNGQYPLMLWQSLQRNRAVDSQRIDSSCDFFLQRNYGFWTFVTLSDSQPDDPVYYRAVNTSAALTDADAYYEAKVTGINSDAYFKFTNVSISWTFGLDNDRNDFIVLSYGSLLETDPKISISTGGALSIEETNQGLYCYGLGQAGAANTEYIRLYHDGSQGLLDCNATGTGTIHSLILQTGGVTAVTIDNTQTVSLSTVVDAGVDTDKFLVLDATGNIDYRTGAEVLSDIGGAPAGTIAIGDSITGGTAGRVLFEGAGPVLADSANLTFDGTALTVNADIALSSGSITSASGAISFGNENLSTSGTVTVSGGSKLILNDTLGDLAIYNDTTAATALKVYFYPNSGTNVANALQFSPRGTGSMVLWLYGTDYVADSANYRGLRFGSSATDFSFDVKKAGTGSLVPLIFKMDATDCLTIETGKTVTFDVAATSAVSLTASGGTKIIYSNASATIGSYNYSTAADTAKWAIRPDSGTNVGMFMHFIPRGTGSAAGTGGIWFYNTDVVADALNWEGLRFGGAGTEYSYNVLQAGTGSLRPLVFKMDSTDCLTIETGATVTLDVAANFTTSFAPVTADGGTIGTASLEVSDYYGADGHVFYLGNDQEITVTHVHNVGIGIAGKVAIGAASFTASEYLHIKEDAPEIWLESTNATGKTWSIHSTSTGTLRFHNETNNIVPLVLNADGSIDISAYRIGYDGSAGGESFDASNNATFSNNLYVNGVLSSGINDTTGGAINSYGPGAGVNEGGYLNLYLGADHDTSFNAWQIRPYEDDLYIGIAGGDTDVLKLTAEKDLHITAGGLVIADSDYIGSASDPDAIQIDSVGRVICSNGVYASGGRVDSGVNDTVRGLVYAYGSAAGSTDGGLIAAFTAADHDGTIQYYAFQAYEDDLHIGTDVDSDLLKLTAGADLVLKSGAFISGVDDVTNGLIILYGQGTGAATGGRAYFYLSADHDTSFQYWSFFAYEDDLTLGPNNDYDAFKFTAEKDLHITAGGLVIADNDYIGSATTPQTIQIAAGGAITVNGTTSIVNGPLYIGTDDSSHGQILLYGSADVEGGSVTFYIGANYDTTIEYWSIKSYEDDLYIGTTLDPDVVKITAEKDLHITAGGLVIADADYIGSATTPQAFSISSAGAITLTGSFFPKQVNDAGPMTATNGTEGEIVYNTADNKFYGCVTTGTPATWAAFH